MLLKLVLRGSEGIGLKGGVAVKFWKGKGAKDDVCSYRQILLASTIAKCIHQTLRPSLRNLFTEQAPALQLGGRKGCSVVYGAHITRSFLRWQSAVRGSCYILFTDIASAYYSVVRELVAKPKGIDVESVSLAGLKLSAGDLELLRQHLAEGSALADAGAPVWLEGLAQRLTDSTWFVMQQDDTPVVTSRGTRPGSSWADILFSFIVRRIIDRRNALQHGHFSTAQPPTIPDDSARSLSPCDTSSRQKVLQDLIWADDIATMRVVQKAADLPVGIKLSVGASSDAFAEYGFRLSYGRSKTAVLAQPAGSGAKAARQHLFGNPGMRGEISALREHEQPVRVPLVSDYKHLGAQVAVGGTMRQELAYRAAQAHAAFKECRRKVFKAPGVPVQRKSFILRAMVLPKLLYGCGAWPPLGVREFRVFSGTLWSFYRQLLCVPHTASQHVSAAETTALLELPGPTATLHFHRLLYLSQLVHTGPGELWTLLRLDRPYAEAMAQSARWLHRWVHKTCPLPDPDTHWDEWVQIILESRNKFKGWVKRAQALEVRRCHVVASLDGLYRAIRSLVDPAEPTAVAPSSYPEVCIPCRKLFNSRVAWSCHAQRVHGYRTPAYLLSKEACRPVCAGCGKLYSSSGRLRNHLRYSKSCLELWGSFQVQDEADCELHPQAPPSQAAGFFDPGTSLNLDALISQPLLTALEESSQLGEETLWELIAEHIEPLETLRATVQRWQQRITSLELKEVADNFLLLLDPDLLGDIPVSRPVKEHCVADVVADWDPLPCRSVTSRAECPPLSLLPPPSVGLAPWGTTSITVRQAQAYSTWLEQACHSLAQCLALDPGAPRGIVCAGLKQGLGPAADWMSAIGAVFSDDGLALSFC